MSILPVDESVRLADLARAVEARLDSERQSRAVVRHSPGPPEFRTVWVRSFCADLAIFRRRFSFSSLVSAKVLSPRSSSSLLASASLPGFRSVSETLRVHPPVFSLLSLLVSATATAKTISFSCGAMSSTWVSVSAIRPNSRREPSELASVSPHRLVARGGQSRQ